MSLFINTGLDNAFYMLYKTLLAILRHTSRGRQHNVLSMDPVGVSMDLKDKVKRFYTIRPLRWVSKGNRVSIWLTLINPGLTVFIAYLVTNLDVRDGGSAVCFNKLLDVSRKSKFFVVF